MNNLANEFAAYVGIDWAGQKHDICLSSTPDSTPEYDQIDSTPEALNEWLRELHRRFPEGNIAVCLEQSVSAYKYMVLHSWKFCRPGGNGGAVAIMAELF